MKKIIITVLALVCALAILQMVTPAMADFKEVDITEIDESIFLLDREKEWAEKNGYSMWANSAIENGTMYACGIATDRDDVFYDAHCSDDVIRKSVTYSERLEKALNVSDAEITIDVVDFVCGYEVCRVIITFDGEIKDPYSDIVINGFDFFVMFYT